MRAPDRCRAPRPVRARDGLRSLIACILLAAFFISVPSPIAAAGMAIVQPLTVGSYVAGQTLTDPTDTANDFFGAVTAMSGDGDTLAVGAQIFSTGAGVVYIYTRSSGSFPTTPTRTLTDPGASPGADAFGNAVALSDDGATLLVGAPTSPTGGVVYAYARQRQLPRRA
jgi:hypothetical protein